MKKLEKNPYLYVQLIFWLNLAKFPCFCLKFIPKDMLKIWQVYLPLRKRKINVRARKIWNTINSIHCVLIAFSSSKKEDTNSKYKNKRNTSTMFSCFYCWFYFIFWREETGIKTKRRRNFDLLQKQTDWLQKITSDCLRLTFVML